MVIALHERGTIISPLTLRRGDASARAVIGPLTKTQSSFTTASKSLHGHCVADVEPYNHIKCTLSYKYLVCKLYVLHYISVSLISILIWAATVMDKHITNRESQSLRDKDFIITWNQLNK